MKNHKDNKNSEDICETHKKVYELFCISCKKHLCNECSKNSEHKDHDKKYLKDLSPKDEDINLKKSKMQYYKNQIESITKKE